MYTKGDPHINIFEKPIADTANPAPMNVRITQNRLRGKKPASFQYNMKSKLRAKTTSNNEAQMQTGEKPSKLSYGENHNEDHECLLCRNIWYFSAR